MALRPRGFAPRLKELLRHFPMVAILGPRQCGKTTFAKQTLSVWQHLDLEKPSDLAKVADDPEEALARFQRHVVFDEAQRFPPLFPLLRSYVDERRRSKGLFVLLGSASPALIKTISESLAGRVGFLDMTPFLVAEGFPEETLWVRGGFPEAFLQKGDQARLDWVEAFTRTFLERDLPQFGIDVSAPRMRTLWAMLAHVHGEIWNASEVASSLGVSYHTVNRYVDILEQTFMVRKLRPYFVNLGKRLVKSPKIYLRDSGLLHYFLGIGRKEALVEHPKRGSSWEGFVIEQVLGAASLRGQTVEPFFWATVGGHEVDLLLKRGGELIPIEIKLHTAPRLSDVRGLVTFLADFPCERGYVVHPRGEKYTLGSRIEVVTLGDLLGEVL